MRYIQRENESLTGKTVYDVTEGGKQAGIFSWTIEGRYDFWIREICLENFCSSYQSFREILEFLKYKASCKGCRAMYIRVAVRNAMLLEWVRSFGFMKIDEECRIGKYGEETYWHTFKYNL